MAAGQEFESQSAARNGSPLNDVPVLVSQPEPKQAAVDSVKNAALPAAWMSAPKPPSVLSRVYDGANRGIGAVLQRFALPQDEVPTDLLGKMVSSTPPWLISLIFHF